MDNLNVDRGIIKWLPFDALSGYKEAICNLKARRAKKDKPILSEDQITMLNYQLSASEEMKKNIVIYYYVNGEIKFLNGVVMKTDFIAKRIKIGNFWVDANMVLLIETD